MNKFEMANRNLGSRAIVDEHMQVKSLEQLDAIEMNAIHVNCKHCNALIAASKDMVDGDEKHVWVDCPKCGQTCTDLQILVPGILDPYLPSRHLAKAPR
jgi:transcription elongation factor Elf1